MNIFIFISIVLKGKIILLIQTCNKSIDPKYKLLKTIKDETIYKGNNIQVKAYKFDNIVTRKSITLVLQHTDDHNLILMKFVMLV